MRDFRRLQNDPPSGVTGAPMDNNILAWQVGLCFGAASRFEEDSYLNSSLLFRRTKPRPARVFHPLEPFRETAVQVPRRIRQAEGFACLLVEMTITP